MNGQPANPKRERSTSSVTGDLSPDDPATSTAPAYRFEACVCRGIVICLAGESVQAVMEQHNRSALHLFWRWRTGRMTLVRWMGR